MEGTFVRRFDSMSEKRKILIIYPHYPPSNLAGVHRARLFAQHLPSFGWEPVILTVHEDYYEEELDWNLHQLLPAGQRIEKVKAFQVTRPRLIGDIGLRSFFQLRKAALKLLRAEHFDFIYIPIPSFYVALIGPYLYRRTGVHFGIDYIDPWVHQFPGSDKKLSRHWWTTELAKWLEPRALKNVSLVTGVAEGYYKGVQDRNPGLLKTCLFAAMPYGGEIQDHIGLKCMGVKPYLFSKNKKLQFIYAGTMLPKAYGPLEALFKAIASNPDEFSEVEFHFIGSGKSPNDSLGYNIKPLAEKYQLWQSVVFEYPKRIPYLDVLIHLDIAAAVFILGSTEPHYTPSKTYQAVLSGKPIMAVLHLESTAVDIIRSTNAGLVLDFKGEEGIDKLEQQFPGFLIEFKEFLRNYKEEQVNREYFEQFSAKTVTAKLVDQLNAIFNNCNEKN